MLLQPVLKVAYNLIFYVRRVVLPIYSEAYNRIRVGDGFTVKDCTVE
jgi:hypothetical protein